jgi:predicted  nucleic acid-binding Zn-ribbon protein
MEAEDEGSLRALRDRLDACEQKQARLYGRLQDAREQIARLKEQLEDCLAEIGKRTRWLTTDDHVDPGNLPPGAAA